MHFAVFLPLGTGGCFVKPRVYFINFFHRTILLHTYICSCLHYIIVITKVTTYVRIYCNYICEYNVYLCVCMYLSIPYNQTLNLTKFLCQINKVTE